MEKTAHFEEDILSDDEIDEVQIGLQEVKEGKTSSIESVAKKLGVSLS